jgi:4-oxalocrotonate tautomerase
VANRIEGHALINSFYEKEDLMPVVIVEMWEGHTLKQKRQLAKDLTDAFVKIGMPAEAVNVIMRENPKDCWATGGQLCSDFTVPPGA